ncbi:MAG: hypothetical protein AAF986_05475 [Pseudomonadota bacterium]
MSGFAFIILLAAFAVVAYWYASNIERNGQGEKGLLAIRDISPDVNEDIKAPRTAPLSAAEKVRKRVQNNG